MLNIKNLSVTADDQPIIDDISLSIKPGEVVAVMGPNGSGKSTLAYALAGHPKYKISGRKSDKKGIISLDGKVMDNMSPDQRAGWGLFLASQYPMAIPGLSVNSFLWQIYKKKHPAGMKRQINSVIEFREWGSRRAKELGIKSELLTRGLNDGFSGGEKKKIEILQMMVFDPKYAILDEIDSGLDVDALSKIAKTVAKIVKEKGMGVMVITHYNRILKYLKADKVVVMENGRITKTGTGKLAEEIENKGYGKSRG